MAEKVPRTALFTPCADEKVRPVLALRSAIRTILDDGGTFYDDRRGFFIGHGTRNVVRRTLNVPVLDLNATANEALSAAKLDFGTHENPGVLETAKGDDRHGPQGSPCLLAAIGPPQGVVNRSASVN